MRNNYNLCLSEKIESSIQKIDFRNPFEREFFEKNKPYKAFEDSWFALMQGIRNIPQLYEKKIYFCYHPNKHDTLVIYNHLCSNILELSNLLNSLLWELNKEKAIWKNADPAELINLRKIGFKEYESSEGWDALAVYDDQTYPQHICLLQDIALLEGSKYSQIRQQTRAVERECNYNLILAKYEHLYKNECEILALNIAENIGRDKNLNIHHVAHANLIFLEYPPQYSYVVKYKNKIISFIAFDVRQNTANFNCMIYKRDLKYISTYTMVKASQEFYRKGIQRINLSGSEFRSLDQWKKKFVPIMQINRIHVLWDKK